jgi:DNA-binding response OmpR family regulator
VQKKILLVEDDGDLIELLSFNLKASGFSVGTAKDGVEGLKKARTLAPDLILLDLMLPELDGFAVCEILRRDPLTATIPIVILTAWSSELARLTVLHAGANAFLTKPFSPRRLVARVQQMIDSN